ncbi:MAG: M20 family metallopeptidase [Gammaproteobacteria bacterium]
MDHKRTLSFVTELWDDSIIPQLVEYVKIPNKSPHFDPNWAEHGYMDEAIKLASKWCEQQSIPGMKVETVRLEGRTPLLFIEIPGEGDDCVLLYGHLDKQPEFTGWEDDLGPWKPVIRDDKLYGRGGADDGYAVFGSLTAILALKEQQIPHARCVVIIECCEESGSYDLPYYIDALKDRIGVPSLVICLDAGAGNYDQLWCTTSLRGNVVGNLRVDVLNEGVHSGLAGGMAASSFRILRKIMDRIEHPDSGEILLKEMHAEIPQQRKEQAVATAKILGNEVFDHLPFVDGMQPEFDDPYELIMNNTWRPCLAVTGQDGMPDFANAGNTLRPYTSVKLSFRTPPTTDPILAGESLKTVLEKETPKGAKVTFEIDSAMGGWNAPPVADWLDETMQKSSQAFFGADAIYWGMGGSIPFMGMLGEKFPEAQFCVTGLLGPKSNAHGPNEFLHIPTGKRLTACVAKVLMDHHTRNK